MSTTHTSAGCDTHDMVVVHRVFRREFSLLPRMVRAVRPGDSRQATVIATHAREMIDVLHHHHSAEDELLWPRLRQRVDLDTDLVARMEAQHRRIAELLIPLDQALDDWSGTAAPAAQARLATVLSALPEALDEHLTEEETIILPIVERTLTAGEWQQLAQRGMAAIGKPRLLVLLGHILEEADLTEQSAFLQHIPRPARIAYRLVGRRTYARETAAQRRGLAA